MFKTTAYPKNKTSKSFNVDVQSIFFNSFLNCIELGYVLSFSCHNVTIMKNAQGDRVIIQEVK